MRKIIVGLIAAASVIAATPAQAHYYGGCKKDKCKSHVVAPYRSWLYSVRHCEWDPQQRWASNTGNGFYGAYQFTLTSWHSVGGWGYPHQAKPLEQGYRAVKLRFSQGTGAWPVCG